MPQGTVKSRLFRGRELLRIHLDVLAKTPGLLESTLQGLETWARSVRDTIRRNES